MSTKTTFKRVALVAVAALGFGMVSVVPSNAALSTSALDAAITSVSVTALTSPARVGTPVTTSFKISNTATEANDVLQFRALVTQVPAGSLLTAYTGVSFTDAYATSGVYDNTGTPARATVAATAGSNTTALGPKVTLTPASGKLFTANATTATVVADTLTFTPDVAGTYKIVVFPDNTNTGSLVSGNKYATWTVTAAGAPATATVSVVNPSAAGTTTTTYDILANNQGALVKVVLKDANGYATAPRGAEVVTLTSNSTTALNKTNSAQAIQLTSSNVELSGTYFGNYTDTVAETVIFSTSGSGSLSAVSGLTASSTATYTLPTAVASAFALSDTSGVSATAISGTRNGGATAITATKSAVSLKVSSAADAKKVAVTISDASGDITGAVNATYGYSVIVTTATDGAASPTYYGTLSVTLPGLTAGVADGTVTVFGHTATAANDLAVALTPALGGTVAAPTAAVASQIAVVAGTVVVTTTVKDTYGIALPNATVTFTTSSTSRNAGLSYTTTTNASGVATFSLTDTSVSTTVLADSVNISASYAGTTASTTAAATVTWKTTLNVSTVKLTSDDYTVAGTANTSVSPQAIAVGSSGAQAGARTITAVVKDAGGVVVIGAPVTFSVAGTGAAIPSTKVTAYTDATGTATSSVYAWIAGTYTITATAGGVSGTATETFNSVSGAERVISATANGNVVTGKAVDRFGNPVLGVTLYATVTAGNGYFGNTGLKTASTPTLADGTATFVLTGDSSTVKVSNINPASVAGTSVGQTSAAKGFTTSATATAFTATTVGTTTTAETGVGASYDAAGVSSASVEAGADLASQASQAANDAAAEATDAANAATDAANAAAEAADAATAAAQDAADAVAALAASVTEMVDALKKQITSLTSLIIKIQKKLKA